MQFLFMTNVELNMSLTFTFRQNMMPFVDEAIILTDLIGQSPLITFFVSRVLVLRILTFVIQKQNIFLKYDKICF
jgi:hypothetical protein